MLDGVQEILRYTGHKAQIVTRPDMPTGPLNRVGQNQLAKQLLGWEPKVRFVTRLRRTIDWCFASKNKQQVKALLATLLTERHPG